MQHTNSVLNSYIEKAMARENQHSQERSRIVQNIFDECMWGRPEEAYRTKEMTSAIKRDIQNARENENGNTVDAYMDRNRGLLDKGMEGGKEGTE